MEFFHSLRRYLQTVGTCLSMTTGTSTTCQCTPTCPRAGNQRRRRTESVAPPLSTKRTARACRCMVTGRTTSTTEGDKTHVSSYTVHTFLAPPKYRSVHARDRLQNDLGLDVHEEAIAHAHPGQTSARRHAPHCPPLLSVPEVRAIVGHDLYPEVITNHMMSLISRRRP